MAKLPTPPPINVALRSELLKLFNQALVEADALKTCITCSEFTEETEICKKFKARPPARVIAFGCSSFFESED